MLNKAKYVMEDYRLLTNKELASALGISLIDENKPTLEEIIKAFNYNQRPLLKAAIELYKRSMEAPLPASVTKAEDVIPILLPLMMDLDKEEFWVLLMDRRCSIIARERLSQGSYHSCTMSIKEVARTALQHNASAVIVCHNHPSGDPNPGESDIKNTKRLKDALMLIEVALVDHIIVAKGGECYSFAEEGIIRIMK